MLCQTTTSRPIVLLQSGNRSPALHLDSIVQLTRHHQSQTTQERKSIVLVPEPTTHDVFYDELTAHNIIYDDVELMTLVLTPEPAADDITDD